MVCDIQSFTEVYKVSNLCVHPLKFQVIEGVLQHLDEVLTMLSDVSGFSIVRFNVIVNVCTYMPTSAMAVVAMDYNIIMAWFFVPVCLDFNSEVSCDSECMYVHTYLWYGCTLYMA